MTSSSANYIANLAKELIRNLEADLQNLHFVHEEIAQLDSTVQHRLILGCEEEDVKSIEDKLECTIRMKSLIAWLREGIKEKDRLTDEVNHLTPEDICKKIGVRWPEEPKAPKTLTDAEYIEGMDKNDRSRIYYLQTRAAAYGKLVHENGSYTKARKEMHELHTRPNVFEHNGRWDGPSLIHYREASVDEGLVDKVYFHLQNKQREAQAELNGLLHKVTEAVRLENIRRQEEYANATALYANQKQEAKAATSAWKLKELGRISELKIVIPDSLKETYDEVTAVGKE